MVSVLVPPPTITTGAIWSTVYLKPLSQFQGTRPLRELSEGSKCQRRTPDLLSCYAIGTSDTSHDRPVRTGLDPVTDTVKGTSLSFQETGPNIRVITNDELKYYTMNGTFNRRTGCSDPFRRSGVRPVNMVTEMIRYHDIYTTTGDHTTRVHGGPFPHPMPLGQRTEYSTGPSDAY